VYLAEGIQWILDAIGIGRKALENEEGEEGCTAGGFLVCAYCCGPNSSGDIWHLEEPQPCSPQQSCLTGEESTKNAREAEIWDSWH